MVNRFCFTLQHLNIFSTPKNFVLSTKKKNSEHDFSFTLETLFASFTLKIVHYITLPFVHTDKGG